MELAIRARGVSKRYADQVVLDSLDLDVAGGIFALLGRNGAGKTTLVNILTTLAPPDAGQATVAGFDIARERGRVRAAIATTGQFAALDDRLTGRENLELFGQLRGLAGTRARQRAVYLLEQFDLTGAQKRAVATYSGGMKRRLDIAASLVTQPAVLFLDEPTTGLDLESRQQVWRDVLGLSQSGTTVFLTTQYLEEAEALADRIAILEQGSIVADGTAAELKDRVGGQSLVLLTPAGDLVEEISIDGTAQAIAAAIAELPTDNPAYRLELRRPSLDDAFLAITSERQRAEIGAAK